ncbi:MAG: ribonuclease III [Lachnospiraceae bacterium]|nr:ribonuclease III [Lachnospiraceae bacterium]
MQVKSIDDLEKVIGYSFKDKSLIKRALTHSSYANEQKINKNGDYERLEFLGDAVLELVSSDFFYHRYANLDEGSLTKMRSAHVCEPALAYCAREFGLEDYILLGKGEDRTGGRNRDSIISDVCEAIIGAMYLDGGMEIAHGFIHRFILNDSDNKLLFYDSKSILQEMVQADNHDTLTYKLVDESGPDHDKEFTVEVYISDKCEGRGKGKTKKSAEQMAAYEAIKKLKG